MRALDQYLFDLEAAPDEPLAGLAHIVLELAMAATGTSGVTTPEVGLPLTMPVVAATADWRPLGRCLAPTLQAVGSQTSWRPAWGTPDLPLPAVAGAGSLPLLADLVLTPFFAWIGTGAVGRETLPLALLTARDGAQAALDLPLIAPYALSGLNRHGGAGCPFPGMTATAWACGLESPTTNGATSASVVGLLCQGSDELAQAALDLAQGATVAAIGADALAGRLRNAVAAALTYTADSDDSWNCALGSLASGRGDCEDGAIALHGLLLAAGVSADRLVTVFGRVGIDRQGHAWVAYRRESDGRWVVLDWTAGPSAVAVTAQTPITDLPYYAYADYALTSQAFFAVRQGVADFFARVAAETLTLPAPTLEATASLGVAAAFSLGTSWLRAAARTASTAHAGLPAPVMAALGGSTFVALALPAPMAMSRTGEGGNALLALSGALGLSLGGAGRAGPTLPRPDLSGRATPHLRASGQGALANARLCADGLAGTLGLGHGDGPRVRLRARAWTGSLARVETALFPLLLLATGGPSDPGRLLDELPPWSMWATGAPEDALPLGKAWNTVSLEVW